MTRSTLFAAAAGAVAVLGFAPFGYWFAPIAALVALLALWHRRPDPRDCAWIGFAFGMGHFLAGVSWVYVSLNVFGMMPAPLAAIATVLFCSVLALAPAFVGASAASLGWSRRTTVLLAFPALWVLFEWVRGWIFTGFPWLNLGYSQTDTMLAGFAPITGVYGISLAAACCAGLIWHAIGRGTRDRLAALVLIVALFGVGAGLQRQTWTTVSGSGFDVALLQGNIPQELKFVPGRFESTLATYARLIEQTNARLIVLPETAIPRFPEDIPPAFLERLKVHARANGADVLLGLPSGDLRSEYFNTMRSFGTSQEQSYSKSHLVPFGEFIPLGFGWIERILKIPLSSFTAGALTQRPLALAGEKVAVNICYEDAFGAEIIRQLPEATVLVNASNVAWFGDSLAPAQHLEISRMRAMETGRFMLRATNTGVTAIIDQRGRVIEALPTFSEGVLFGRVQGYGGATPYVQSGNAILWLAAALVLLSAIASARGGHRAVP